MRIAISNIAWDVDEDDQVLKLLQRYKVDAVDIAPTKYFSNLKNVTKSEILRVKSFWNDSGIELTGMQSLLFGTSGLNVFGSSLVQEKLLFHLEDVCKIASQLGIRYLVFGSPKNRDRTGLSDEEALDKSVRFFNKLGELAKEHDVFFCLEPNPKSYGANFMVTSEETYDVVSKINHPNVKMQLDIGAVTINAEDISLLLPKIEKWIGHIHASEPNLIPLGDTFADHNKIAFELRKYLSNKIVSIEMLATKEESHLSSIERALKVASKTYGVN